MNGGVQSQMSANTSSLLWLLAQEASSESLCTAFGPRGERIVGDDPVLERLARLGGRPRSFKNLVTVGFPPAQLRWATQRCVKNASTTVEIYAKQRMLRGFYEDESLLGLFVDSFGCTDWKLEHSPWFFSSEEYECFFERVLKPAEFCVQRLLQRSAGEGFEEWRPLFERFPLALALSQARAVLWRHIEESEYPWRHAKTYADVRATAMFRYLGQRITPLRFYEEDYRYLWERRFRRKFAALLLRFEQALLQAQQHRQPQQRAQEAQQASWPKEILRAFALLSLEPRPTTRDEIHRAFRRCSKKAHPDHGGTERAFCELIRGCSLLEAWLSRD